MRPGSTGENRLFAAVSTLFLDDSGQSVIDTVHQHQNVIDLIRNIQKQMVGFAARHMLDSREAGLFEFGWDVSQMIAADN